MDFFKEANWYFTEEDRKTWYFEGIVKKLIIPRIGRVGIMLSPQCQKECGEIIKKRDEQKRKLKLFSDIAVMEKNDLCNICINEKYDEIISRLTHFAKSTLEALEKTSASLLNNNGTKTNPSLDTMKKIRNNINIDTVKEYFSFYTTRQLFGVLAGDTYNVGYGIFYSMCKYMQGTDNSTDNSIKCPPILNSTSISMSKIWGDYADSAFSSSVATYGSPLPFFSSVGEIFNGTEQLGGGSGVNLTGNDTKAFINLKVAQHEDWKSEFDQFPLYKWFDSQENKMAGSKLPGN